MKDSNIAIAFISGDKHVTRSLEQDFYDATSQAENIDYATIPTRWMDKLKPLADIESLIRFVRETVPEVQDAQDITLVTNGQFLSQIGDETGAKLRGRFESDFEAVISFLIVPDPIQQTNSERGLIAQALLKVS